MNERDAHIAKNLKTNCFLKEDIHTGQFLYIHPALMMMLGFTLNFAQMRGIDVCITSIIRTPAENKAVGAVSETHVEGRGLDISLRSEYGWRNSDVAELEQQINEKFSDVGALVWRDGELVSRPIVVHDAGSGPHIHLQVKP